MARDRTFDELLAERRRTRGPIAAVIDGAGDPDWFDAVAAVPRGAAGAVQDVYGLADTLAFDSLPDWRDNPFGESSTVAGGAIEGVTNFAAGFIPVAGWLGRAGKIGRLADVTRAAERTAKAAGLVGKARAISAARAATAGAVADFAVWDGHEERLSDLIQSVPGLSNPISEYLSADDADPELLGRFKSAIEGVGVGLFADAVVLGVRAVKAGRRARLQAGATPESIDAAADAAAPPEAIERAVSRASSGVGAPSIEPEELVDVVKTNPGGFTYDPRAKRVVPLDEFGPDQYVVSKPGAEASFDPGDTGAIEAWVRRNAGALDADEFIGGWLNSGDGKFYLDVSRVVEGRDAALAAGRAGDQLAVFHPATAETIETGVTRAAKPDVAASGLSEDLRTAPRLAARVHGYRFILESVARRNVDLLREVASGERAGNLEALPVEVKGRLTLLRDLGIDDDKLAEITARMDERVQHVEDAFGVGAGVPDTATNAFNPRKLTAAERIELAVRPQDMNLEHFKSPEGALALLRTVDELFWNEIREDISNLAAKTLDAQATDAMRTAADMVGAPSEQAFMAQVASGLSEDLRTAPRLAARVHGYRFVLESVARRNVDLLREVAAVASGERAGNLEALLLRARGNAQFLASLQAGVKGLTAEVGRALGGFRMTVGDLDVPDFILRLGEDPLEMARLVNEQGGRDHLMKLVRQELAAYGDGGVGGAVAINKLARASAGRRFFDMTIEYWMSSLLSSPRTFAVNFMGPLLNSVYRPIETMVGSSIQKALGAARGNLAVAAMQDKVMKTAVGQIMNLASAVPEAFAAARKMAIGGDNILDPRSTIADTIARRKAITAANAGLDRDSVAGRAVDWFGNIVRVPPGLLAKTDEFVKQLNYRARARAKLAVEALDKGVPPDNVAEYVATRMDQLVWQNQAYTSRQVYRRGLAEARNRGIVTPGQVEKFALDYARERFDPTLSALSKESLAFAEEVTFTAPARPGSVSWSLQRLVAQHPYLRLVLPFINTPLNILKFTGQRLDAVGVARGVAGLVFPDYAKSLANSKNRFVMDLLSNDPARIADATGRFAMGASVAAFALSKAYDGTITGRGPSDPEQRALLTDAGWLPYSVRVGDGYMSYARLDPLATLVGTMADIADYARFAAVEDQDKIETLGNGLLVAMAQNFTNKSYLTGIANFVEALQAPDRFMPSFLNRFVGSFVPTAAAHAVLAVGGDENLRDVRSILDAVVARTPGLSGLLPTERNLLGEPVVRVKALGAGTVGRWIDMFNPVAYREVSDDVVKRELVDLGHAFTPPKRTVNGVDLSDVPLASGRTAYDRWGELHGTVKLDGLTLKDALRREIKSSGYKKLSPVSLDGLDSPRIGRINSIIREYRARAYQQLLKEAPDLSLHDRVFQRNKRRLKLGVDSRIIPAR